MERTKYNCVIGIDPGVNGGIAVFVIGKNTKAIKMPKDEEELRAFLAYYAENFKPIIFLEKLSIRPDDISVQGGEANMGKLYRIQKMMASYERLKLVIEGLGVPYILVHPMKWQTALKLRTLGVKEEKADRKLRYRNTAARLYMGVRVALWNADALLIMHFGRWALVNDEKWIRANLPEREHQKLF